MLPLLGHRCIILLLPLISFTSPDEINRPWSMYSLLRIHDSPIFDEMLYALHKLATSFNCLLPHLKFMLFQIFQYMASMSATWHGVLCCRIVNMVSSTLICGYRVDSITCQRPLMRHTSIDKGHHNMIWLSS